MTSVTACAGDVTPFGDSGQGPCGGDSFGSPCPQHVSDRGSEPGPHAEVDDEVDGGVGHLADVGKCLDDVERVAEFAWGKETRK